METTKKMLLAGLDRYSLSKLPGRPYDCSFELLAAPPERKRLIMVGFNGSSVDQHLTNAESIIGDFNAPSFSNVQAGTEGKWGIKHLATRLQNIPEQLGFSWRDTLYTNALLMCSKDALSLKKDAQESAIGNLDQLIEKSMGFFEEVTVPLCKPELIIAYSNGMNSHSAARLLLKTFGNGDEPEYISRNRYYSTFCFTARFKQFDVPVVGIRHMSRFKPNVQYIREAWEKTLTTAPDSRIIV
jgi:hypothetical protein